MFFEPITFLSTDSYLNSVAGPGGHPSISIFSQESVAVSDLLCAVDWAYEAARLSTNTLFPFFLQEIQEDKQPGPGTRAST